MAKRAHLVVLLTVSVVLAAVFCAVIAQQVVRSDDVGPLGETIRTNAGWLVGSLVALLVAAIVTRSWLPVLFAVLTAGVAAAAFLLLGSAYLYDRAVDPDVSGGARAMVACAGIPCVTLWAAGWFFAFHRLASDLRRYGPTARPPTSDGGRRRPPGWYVDPFDPARRRLRWWDGRRWTEHIAVER